jgi:type VII secretion-associated protein (TIGR03931 family)
MTAAICAVGPVTITRLPGDPPGAHPAGVALVQAAIDGGDGRWVLVGDEPAPLQRVWVDSLAPLLAGADRAVLIHPSWWTAPRIDVVRAAVAGLVADAELMSRSVLLGHRHPGAVIVEIAPHAVLVLLDGSPVAVHERNSAPEGVAQRVAETVLAAGRGRPVVIDTPEQVPGADEVAVAAGKALARHAVRVERSGDRQLFWAATTLVGPAVRPDLVEARGARRIRWPAVALTTVLSAAILAAGVSVAPGEHRERPAPTPVAALVEGGVTLQVPAHWIVRRVTSGPGSARVQVVSPDDGDAVVHVTQSRLVDSDPAATASALRRAIDAEPQGTFVDFNPADQRAGRAAVTYREVRPGRDILWTVLVDGDVRISIGCQNATGRSIAVAAACDDAIRTAQRIA